ncbi:MAG: serine hydrolase domain-containing protein [Pseudolabrys sp.]
MAFDMPGAKRPEDVGLSSERLKRLTDALKTDIDKGTVPGAVVLVARHGQIACLEALGYRDREAGVAMAPDTIFRIASMTKPFTSVATMMLAEEGKLLIADPVARSARDHTNSPAANDVPKATRATNRENRCSLPRESASIVAMNAIPAPAKVITCLVNSTALSKPFFSAILHLAEPQVVAF